MKLKGTISYNGNKFYGSQIQNEHISIASVILKALNSINIDTKIDFSGRTDRGVHATNQVISFDIPDIWNSRIEELKDILNKSVAPYINFKSLVAVASSFHARYSAKKRVYRYIVTTKKTTPFNSDFITYIDYIDEELIKTAISSFVGTHDFEFFAKSNTQIQTTIRTMYCTQFYKYKDIYVFKFEANGFLRTQIRLMVGFLIALNSKKVTIDDLNDQLNKKRVVYNKPAPSNGLYLCRVKYH